MINIDKQFYQFYKNKRVLVTGHTGFKGSWMVKWLSMMGANVWGVSLKDVSNPNMFNKLNLKNLSGDLRIDLTNLKNTKNIINRVKPDYIFHLAAQPLVLDSIKKPIKTIYANTKKLNSKLNAYLLQQIKFMKILILTEDTMKMTN